MTGTAVFEDLLVWRYFFEVHLVMADNCNFVDFLFSSEDEEDLRIGGLGSADRKSVRLVLHKGFSLKILILVFFEEG